MPTDPSGVTTGTLLGTLFTALLALAACGEPSPALPTMDRCDDPAAGVVEGLEILTDLPPTLVLDDGATLPLLFGGQGAEMTLFRVGLRGDVPACVSLRVRATRPDGVTHLDLDEDLHGEAIGDLRAVGPIAAVEPGDTVGIDVEAYGRTLHRDFEVGGLRVSLRVSGPAEMIVDQQAELTVQLSGRAVEPTFVSLEASPDGQLELESTELELAPGESSVRVGITARGSGTALVRARLDSYESPTFAIAITP